MRVLYLGESWNGSSARAFRESLSKVPGVDVQDIPEDIFRPSYRSLVARLSVRLLRPVLAREVSAEIMAQAANFRPDVFVAYKGWSLAARTVQAINRQGIFTVNLFPDASPVVHGRELARSVAHYRLIASTKPLHLEHWASKFGYTNECICIPHGFDPALHVRPTPPAAQPVDVLLAATWRTEYEILIRRTAELLAGAGIAITLVGHGWADAAARLPRNCTVSEAATGVAYVDTIRSAKIVIAPVQREYMWRGARHEGDVDSTRTYELAAAYCFFLHRRTQYVEQIYSPEHEVPTWDSPEELAQLIIRFLPDEASRRAYAERAHRRAVPHYSLDARTCDFVNAVRYRLDRTA
ncbi:MAG: hypothetical protein RJA99_2890 [Pseudomonadota bacterium]|jgi:hypothetical protein